MRSSTSAPPGCSRSRCRPPGPPQRHCSSASSDGSQATFAPIYIADIEYSVPVAASRMIMLDFNLYGLQYIQLRSGTAGTPVQQAADRVIKLICASRP